MTTYNERIRESVDRMLRNSNMSYTEPTHVVAESKGPFKGLEGLRTFAYRSFTDGDFYTGMQLLTGLGVCILMSVILYVLSSGSVFLLFLGSGSTMILFSGLILWYFSFGVPTDRINNNTSSGN